MERQLVERLRHLSPHDLAALGMHHIAYVRGVVMHGRVGWSIHAADGSPIAVADGRDMAFAVARQHQLEPLSVH